jgi:hypothetical protein
MRRRLWDGIVLAVILIGGLPGVSVAQTASRQLSAAERQQLRIAESTEIGKMGWAIRAAGLAQDKNNIALFRSYLKPNDRPQDVRAPDEPLRRSEYVQVSLQALGRLSAYEALPDIESLIASTQNSGTADYARAVRARILASKEKSPGARISRFLAELERTAEQLNTVARQPQPNIDGPPAFEVLAVRELADMIYLYSDEALYHSAKAAGIKLEIDPPSSLKIKYAFMKPGERVNKIIEELANLKVRGANHAEFLTQMAINAGDAAGIAAENKLRQMQKGPRFEYKKTRGREERVEQLRRAYNSKDVYTRQGFFALIDVVGSMGNPMYSEILEELAKDKDSDIAQYARRSIFWVKKGVPIQRAFF